MAVNPTRTPNRLETIARRLCREVDGLSFPPPVAFVYNPLAYAFAPYRLYVRRYGAPPKQALLVGMNPGPWGMAQTGIPFGEIHAVRSWMGIEAPVGKPARLHPRRPVLGFACRRSEPSGRRLWGLAARIGPPESFFRRFFVVNYCPLLFFDREGANLTPERLPAQVSAPLFSACDRALAETAAFLEPQAVVGIGRFAAERARVALAGFGVVIGTLPHPSPANPAANRDWEGQARAGLAELGLAC
ncbi:MAG: uracil-DNA glycosylase family protein [Desulfobacterales bacterium]